jgi:alpha-N-acetylglucosamine transferase
MGSAKKMLAWITLLTQPSYLDGVRTLNRSLQNTRSRYPLVVMVTGNIDQQTRRLLADEGCLLREVTALKPSAGIAEFYANPRFSEVWTKLAAWRWTEFERLAFLDADMLAVKNMDEVFDTPLPAGWIAACHACRCNPYRIPSYPPDWVPANCYYSYLTQQGAKPLPENFIPYFNSGFLLLTPDKHTASELEYQLASISDLGDYRFPEQDLLNAYFRQRWQPLPYIYNALKTLSIQHTNVWDRQQVKNIHYILSKPWQPASLQAGDPPDPYNELNRLWQQTYGELDDK